MGLPINFDPAQPVANTPFFSPQTNSISTPQGANLVIGSGLDVSQGGTLSAIGTVAVTRVDTGVASQVAPLHQQGPSPSLTLQSLLAPTPAAPSQWMLRVV